MDSMGTADLFRLLRKGTLEAPAYAQVFQHRGGSDELGEVKSQRTRTSAPEFVR